MEKIEYHFFWKGPLSNWSKSPFVFKNVEYNCGEQYMMHQKALLFGDLTVSEEIMNEPSPRKQKDLGRKVANFEKDVWELNCKDIMIRGLFEKFVQNQEHKKALLATEQKELVEASPNDDIWGIGFDEENAMANIERWGTNYLGQVLMAVRKKIQLEDSFKSLGLISISPEWVPPMSGKYLVRTIGDSKVPYETEHILTAYVDRHWDEKKLKWKYSIDVHNQIPTHISKYPVLKK